MKVMSALFALGQLDNTATSAKVDRHNSSVSLWLGIGVLFGVSAPVIQPARAADASFGCKVLLCAAATNPSWSGIPYCVPVMNELFNILDDGGSWPSCPEGGTVGGLGYEPYLPCPDGSTPGELVNDSSNSGVQVWQPNANGSQCATQKARSSGQFPLTNGIADASGQVTVKARPTRDSPYNVVIQPNGSQPITFWFSLRAK